VEQPLLVYSVIIQQDKEYIYIFIFYSKLGYRILGPTQFSKILNFCLLGPNPDGEIWDNNHPMSKFVYFKNTLSKVISTVYSHNTRPMQ